MPKKKSIRKTSERHEEKQNVYSIVLDIGGTKYETSGETISEAIAKLSPAKLGGKSIVTVTREDKNYSFPIVPFQLRRLLVNKMYQAIFQKRIEPFLKKI